MDSLTRLARAYNLAMPTSGRTLSGGMDPIAVREAEIGARPHYFKVNHQTEHDFERQMGRLFRLLARVMRPGAYACFVVGRSIIHSREIDNASLLGRAAPRARLPR